MWHHGQRSETCQIQISRNAIQEPSNKRCTTTKNRKNKCRRNQEEVNSEMLMIIAWSRLAGSTILIPRKQLLQWDQSHTYPHSFEQWISDPSFQVARVCLSQPLLHIAGGCPLAERIIRIRICQNSFAHSLGMMMHRYTRAPRSLPFPCA